MIKNLENKMELQVNSKERRIKKMQEMFNKDLEEIKRAHIKWIMQEMTSKTLFREPTVE